MAAMQCSGDPFRLLKYDICGAIKDLRSTKPLLVERHNVTPGMFLVRKQSVSDAGVHACR